MDPQQFQEALSQEDYIPKECDEAIRGEKIPSALGDEATRKCVIRGIRYNPGFATELHGLYPAFTRALNARSIMSNVIPLMESLDDFPYCIWHPDLASEETYRELAARYPQTKYQVGRACAVAGYSQLYQELELLPDVHIAEEARESGSLEIYDSIMAAPAMYSVMNDYCRTIHTETPQIACLNGDTCVRYLLDVKQKHFKDDPFFQNWCVSGGFKRRYFDITEDMGIDIYESGWDPHGTQQFYGQHDASQEINSVMHLLYSPLPINLPTVKKDALILMAAYNGDVDRYVRLRRPRMVEWEENYILRGIHHNTMFAKWWSLQALDEVDSSGGVDEFKAGLLKTSITARFIMNNDLSRVPCGTPKRNYPKQFWFPIMPHEPTLREIIRRQPEMADVVLRACIIGGYRPLYDELAPKVTPTICLLNEARASADSAYLQDIEKRIMEQDLRETIQRTHFPGWMKWSVERYRTPLSSAIFKVLTMENFLPLDEGPYQGLACNIGDVELHVVTPDIMRREDVIYLDDLYKDDITCQGDGDGRVG